MTKLLDEAITKVRTLPEHVQDAVADILLEIAEQPSRSVLTDEQAAEVELAQREARAGKIATDEEVATLWKKFGL